MKFEMEYTVGGRKVSASQFGNELEKAVMQEAEEGISRVITSVRCPVHHSSPSHITSSRHGDQLRWQWEACCDELTTAVENALR